MYQNKQRGVSQESDSAGQLAQKILAAEGTTKCLMKIN